MHFKEFEKISIDGRDMERHLVRIHKVCCQAQLFTKVQVNIKNCLQNVQIVQIVQSALYQVISEILRTLTKMENISLKKKQLAKTLVGKIFCRHKILSLFSD